MELGVEALWSSPEASDSIARVVKVIVEKRVKEQQSIIADKAKLIEEEIDKEEESAKENTTRMVDFMFNLWRMWTRIRFIINIGKTIYKYWKMFDKLMKGRGYNLADAFKDNQAKKVAIESLGQIAGPFIHDMAVEIGIHVLECITRPIVKFLINYAVKKIIKKIVNKIWDEIWS